MVATLRQSVFSCLAGYEGTNDAERLFRAILERIRRLRLPATAPR